MMNARRFLSERAPSGALRTIFFTAFAALLLAAGACHRHARVDGAARALPPQIPAATFAAASLSSSGNKTPKLEPNAEAKALSDAFEATAKAVRPCVVRIDVQGTIGGAPADRQAEPDLPDFLKRFFDGGDDLPPEGVVQGTGAGIIVDGKGDALTNSHVVRGFTKLTVQLADGRSFAARVVGADPLTDVAVVRIEKAPSDLVVARLGDSDALRIGEWAIAVGSPLGMDQTVTVGIISGVGSTGAHFRFESGERVRKYIQTDAKINPGNSGGPLVDLEGEVVGINTLINVGPGGSYGFAIPINQAWDVAGHLLKEGRVRYPYIGVSVMTLTPALKQELEHGGQHLPAEGAFVGNVALGGPAASAGIKVGDVITGIGGHAVKSADDVVAALSAQRIGEKVRVDDVRDQRTQSIDVQVGEYPGATTAEAGGAKIGLALQTLTPPLAQSLGLDPSTKGAVVTDVVAGSPADKAGLAVGDVVREVDRKPVQSADEAAAAIHARGGTHLLRVTSAPTGTTRFVSVAAQ